MSINPWHNWEAYYEILPNKRKIVSELKKIAEKVHHIYLATDLNREGEAIAWHLQEVIGGDKKRYSRITFNEITKKAIFKAFKEPRKLNINRINAQKTRRFMDRLVSYMISPLLWGKISWGLSAGRVQSLATRLIVEREYKIKTFIPEEYWKIHLDVLTPEGKVLPLQVTHQNGKPFRLQNYNQTITVISLLEKAHYRVLQCKDRITNVQPSAPFTTASLQQAANNYLDFSVKKTMMLAQLLYEAGYVTYIRTDSINLSLEAINAAHSYISKTFGEKHLSKRVNFYLNQKKSQEAHEAIRPSNIAVTSEMLKDIEANAKRLYQLIWCQFCACQMTSARLNSRTLIVGAKDFCLKAHGFIMQFDGWIRTIPNFKK